MNLKPLFCFLLVIFTGSIVMHAQDIGSAVHQKPFSVSGSLGLGAGTYSVDGISPRQNASSYLISGAPVISLFGVSFPFTLVVSDQQRGFTQPFNQYGISPQYKWLTVHAGWQSINWSQFTLAGYNFLGGGVEINPGKLRAGFIYGRFNRAIDGDPAQLLPFQTITYRRTGYSGRLGYGTEPNHFDLTMVDAKDDPNSLNALTLHLQTPPAQNLVLGFDTRISLFKHLVWDIEGAGSIYTRNRQADSLTNEQLRNFTFLRSLIPINTTSQLRTAGQTAINYASKKFNIGLQYRRVDPDYQSMGAYYFETDVENYTVQSSVRLFKSQLQISGSLGTQHDDLQGDKAYQSKRSISSFAVSYNNIHFGADVRYSNYGITQDRGLNPIIDTFRVARTNYNFNGLLRVSIGKDVTNNLILIGNIQSLSDLNHFTAGQSESTSKTGNVSYQVNFNKAAFGISANYNYTIADLYLIHTVFYGPSLGLNKQIGKGKFLLGTTFSYQQQQNNYVSAGNIINGIANGSWRVTKKDGINASLTFFKK